MRYRDINNVIQWLRSEIKDIQECRKNPSKSNCLSKSSLINELPDKDLSNIFNNTSKSNHILDYLLQYYKNKNNTNKVKSLIENIENNTLLHNSFKDKKIKRILDKYK